MTQLVRKGKRVNLLEKGRLRTLSSTVRSRKSRTRRYATERSRWVYCSLYNISRRGLTRVAYPCARQCESPTVG